MHELPIAESVLNIALRHAEKEDAARITDLYLLIGQLSSIVDDSIQFYWDIISRDTLAEGATLHFERIPMQMLCLDCGQSYHPEAGTLGVSTLWWRTYSGRQGDEFRLESIAIEKREEPLTPSPLSDGGISRRTLKGRGGIKNPILYAPR